MQPTGGVPDGSVACISPEVQLRATEAQCRESVTVDASFGSALSLVGDLVGDGSTVLAIAAGSQVHLPRDMRTGKPSRSMDTDAVRGVVHLVHLTGSTATTAAYGGGLLGLQDAFGSSARAAVAASQPAMQGYAGYYVGSISSKKY